MLGNPAPTLKFLSLTFSGFFYSVYDSSSKHEGRTMLKSKEEVAKNLLTFALKNRFVSPSRQAEAWQEAFNYVGFDVKISAGVLEGKNVFMFDGNESQDARAFLIRLRNAVSSIKTAADAEIIKLIENSLEECRRK